MKHSRHHLPTVAALVALAFIFTDVAHEVIGHGAGFLLAGGREGILTTTRLITTRHFPSPGWRIFDLGGPVGNLLWAGGCLFALNSLRRRAPRLGLFLWAGTMFGFFWEFGYAMKSAVTGSGDYLALVTGCAYPLVARIILFLAGFFLYRAAIDWLARSFPTDSSDLPLRLTIYLSGGLVACAGPIFDPRGAAEIFNSGFLTGFASAVGIWFMASRAPQKETPPDPTEIVRSLPLISLAVIALLLFVIVLGPGISFAV